MAARFPPAPQSSCSLFKKTYTVYAPPTMQMNATSTTFKTTTECPFANLYHGSNSQVQLVNMSNPFVSQQNDVGPIFSVSANIHHMAFKRDSTTAWVCTVKSSLLYEPQIILATAEQFCDCITPQTTCVPCFGSKLSGFLSNSHCSNQLF